MAITHDFVSIDDMDSSSGWNRTGTISAIAQMVYTYDEPPYSCVLTVSGSGTGTVWKNFSSLDLEDKFVMLNMVTGLVVYAATISWLRIRLYESSNRGGDWAEWDVDLTDWKKLSPSWSGFKIFTTQPYDDSGDGLGFLTDVDCIEIRFGFTTSIPVNVLCIDYLRYGTYVRVTEGSEVSPNTFQDITDEVEQADTENYPLRVVKSKGQTVTIRCPIQVGAGSTTWLVDTDKYIVLEVYNSDDPTSFFIQNNSNLVLGEEA